MCSALAALARDYIYIHIYIYTYTVYPSFQSIDKVTSTKVRLLLGGEPIGSTIECNVAELQCFDLFREKLFPVRDHETKEEALKKIFNTAVDGFLEVDLTFVKRMFPKSVPCQNNGSYITFTIFLSRSFMDW